MLFAAWPRLAPFVLLTFIPLSILWKGGKTLETTWLLTAVAWFCTLAYWAERKREGDAVRQTSLQLWVLLMLFLLWTFLSYFFSATGNYGLDEVLRDSSLALLFLWASREASRDVYGRSLAARIIQVLIVATAIAALLGTVVYAFQPVSRFTGSFFDPRFHTDYWPNAWAELLLMVWPLVLVWHFRHRWLVLSFLLATLFLSYSRAAYVACGAQILLWGFFLWKGERHCSGRRSLGHIVAVLCVTAGIILSLNAIRVQFAPVLSVAEKLTFTAAEGASSITERWQFWRQAWQLAQERPLFGWGPYSFRFVQTRLQEGVFATSDHAHNIFLKYAAERGFPAALLFALFLLAILLPTFTKLFRAQTRQPVPLSIVLSLVGILTHLLLDFNAHFVGVALPFWLLLALLSSTQQPTNQPTNNLLRLAEVSLATAIMVIALFEGRFLLFSSFGRHAEARGDFPVALRWYGRSRRELFSRDLHLSRAHLFLLQEKAEDALSALDDAFRVNREDARAWKLLGDARSFQKDFSAAQKAYEEALRLGKWNHLGALRGLIGVLRAQGERNAIAERREEFSALLAAYLVAIERNTHFVALTPNVEDFLAVTNALAELFPETAPQYQAMGARADRHARTERERIAARPVGRLW